MTNDESLDKLKLKELTAMAKSLKLTHWSRLNKAELRDLLLQERAKFDGDQDAKNDSTVVPSSESAPVAARKSRDANRATDSPKRAASESPTKKTRKRRGTNVVQESKTVEFKTSESASSASVVLNEEKSNVADLVAEPIVKRPRRRRGNQGANQTEQPDSPSKSENETPDSQNSSNQNAGNEEERRAVKPRRRRSVASRKSVVRKEEAAPAESTSTSEAKEDDPARKTEPDATSTNKSGAVPSVAEQNSKPAPDARRVKTKRRARSQKENTVEAENSAATPNSDRAAKSETNGGEPNVEEEKSKKSSNPTTKPVKASNGSQKNVASKDSDSKPIFRVSRSFTSRKETDYLRLGVCNSFWLWTQWDVSENNMTRVRSAMGPLWHTSEPVLRVYRVDREPRIASARREHIADVPVRLRVRSWYVPVENPPASFMLELGYQARDGEFFTLASSNIADTPPLLMHDAPMASPGSVAAPGGFNQGFPRSHYGSVPRGMDLGNYGRPYAESGGFSSSFSDSSSTFMFADPASGFMSEDSLSLKVDAEVVIKGVVSQGASIKIRDERVQTKPDGYFSVRFELPERRHVFPVVATSGDEMESRTIILAIDRNTKTLDPIYRDEEE